MIENVTPLIDSLEIRLSDIFEFEDVEFQCPAGGGMVPLSPMPFAPSSVKGVGVSMCPTSNGGMSVNRGSM